MRTLALILLLLLAITLTGQEFGFKAGINVSSLGKNDNGLESRIGYLFGAVFLTQINEDLELQSELVYSLQGAKDINISESKRNYTYLNLPVMVNALFLDKFMIQIGGQTGLLLSGKIKDPIDNSNITNLLKRVDFAVIVGLGIDLNDRITSTLRYQFGLNNTVKASPNSTTKFQNKVLQISMGIKLI